MAAKKTSKKPGRPGKRHLGVHIPEDVGALFDAAIEAARAEVPVGAKLSETGYLVMLIVQDAEKKGIKRKR